MHLPNHFLSLNIYSNYNGGSIKVSSKIVRHTPTQNFVGLIVFRHPEGKNELNFYPLSR